MDIPKARGYEIKTETGWIFEIGNEWLIRRIICAGGRIGTTSLTHGVSGEEYLEETVEEFALTLRKGPEQREFSFKDFHYVSHSFPASDDSMWELKIDLEADLDGHPLHVSLYYLASADKDQLSKYVQLHGDRIPGWVVESITVERLRLKETVQGIIPHSRYPKAYPNSEDNVHVEPDKADTNSPNARFAFGDTSRCVVAQWGTEEGLYFHSDASFGEEGEESFDRSNGLVMRCGDPTSWKQIASAEIGAYSGPPEIGFKRYRESLQPGLSTGNKPTPVSWNTWFVTRKNNVPLLHNYDRNLLMEYIDRIAEAGFYDVVHLDLGWEAGWPMAPDKSKFPNGLDEIVKYAKDRGLDMGFWINPFTCSYWKSDIEEEHPEWLIPDKVSGQSGAHAICPLTDYWEYVRDRMIELVTRYNARVIYWDGGDWNISECAATNHKHEGRHDVHAEAITQFSRLVSDVQEARPGAMIVLFSLPFDNHRVMPVDKQQISDTYSFPTGQSELIHRQQMYQMTFEHPYRAIWGGWYGVNWIDAGKDNLKRPLRELIHAELSMIGNGACQAGASIDLAEASPQFIEFLRKMFAWRKRFEHYFTVYQHILGFPDGENVDGEGHIIDGKGFLIFINPTEEEKTINLPLDEPELELSIDGHYGITDWSNLETGKFLGRAKLTDKFELELAPLEVKLIGINVTGA